MTDKIITVGITAFKNHKYLKGAIRSVLNQNAECWLGVLILDGGSNKKTRKIFQEFEHPNFQKYAFEKNQGPFGTRTKAIELSQTEWYYQLDGDDILPSNAIDDVLDTIKNSPNAEFIYGNCEHFSNNSSTVKKPLSDPDALCIRPLFNAATPIKKSLFDRLGGFSKDFYINADWDFWLSVYERNIIGAYTDNLIYKRRRRFNNVGSNYLHLRPIIVEKIIERHPCYFFDDKRKNNARFGVYQQLARHYKAIGDRKNAAKYAREALKYGNTIAVFNTIFLEEKMSIFRYRLRRLGRIF